ncbi:MAG: ABC transporter permease [Cyclobacteriaceae bacterium]
MLTNYLKIAIRNLYRYKGFSFIAVSGLTLGMTCCLAIFLFVRDELSYDQYHQNKENIYRLATSFGDSYGAYDGIAKVHGPWGPTAVVELPQVENMTRFVPAGQNLFQKGDSRFYENKGFITDSTVFDIFDFEFVAGKPSSALTHPDAIVISESLAKKYFGSLNAIGQTLTIENSREASVTGVLKDVARNSHFTFDYLLPMVGYNHPQKDSWEQWNQFYTYLLLRPDADPALVANRFRDLLGNHVSRETVESLQPFLQPLTSIHLHSNLFREINANSDITYVYIFAAIGLLVLIISSINFINLTTARALTRMKEVGVRKSNGALRSQLTLQYLSETVVISFVALIFALGLLAIMLPSFNLLTGKQLTFSLLVEPQFVSVALGICLLVGFLSGSYPALYLARLKPSDVLKGKTKTGTRQVVRQGLVVLQFAISIFLIVAAITIYQQLEFIQSKKLGFNPSELITIPIQSGVLREKSETVKNELLKLSAIESVSISGGQPGGSDWGIPVQPEGIDPDQVPSSRVLAVDSEFVPTFEIELSSGRNFSKDIASDTAAYLINEEAARQLGWDNPLSKTISMPAVGRVPGPVVGVVKDFHFRSLKEKIGPVVLFIPPTNWFSMYTVRVRSEQMADGIEGINKVFSQFDPAHPLTYSFFDESYGQLYDAERRLGKLVGLFTGIGIFVACLGLFSLAAFMIEQRTKEIGIRKVMGASAQSISYMLTSDLIKLVLTGFLIATPIGYYVMQNWLGNFQYKIDLSPSLFLLTGLSALALSGITIGYKVLKAGLTNPVDSLRVE